VNKDVGTHRTIQLPVRTAEGDEQTDLPRDDTGNALNDDEDHD